MHVVDVIGLGCGPALGALDAAAALALEQAELLVAGRAQLAAVADHRAEKLAIAGPLDAVVASVAEASAQGRRVVILASGDPLFYGLGARLAEFLGPERLKFHPGVSSVQTAAARLGRPWAHWAVVSLHGRDDRAPLWAAISRRETVAVYTDPRHAPDRLATLLLERGADCLTMTVLERLGFPDERVRRVDLPTAAATSWLEPNLVLLDKTAPPELPPRLGLADELLAPAGTPVTARPVRAAALALLDLPSDGVLWDLGAGTGSVSIEAALLLPHGRVLAVEHDAARLAILRRNVRRTHSFQVRVVDADMHAGLDTLPDPWRVFVGGGLATSTVGLREAVGRLPVGGVVVVSAVLLGTLEQARAELASAGLRVSVTQLACAESRPLAGDLRLQGANPVFLVRGEKA